MGKKSNVNPDHYKTAGRTRQGEDIVQAAHKRTLTQHQASATARRGSARGRRRREAAGEVRPAATMNRQGGP